MAARRIAVRALHEAVANRIREMIRKGDLTTGQRIVEKRLCEELGVSRTPLREALRTLSSEGLVELVPNRGAFVSKPTMAEVRDMFEAMSVLEGTCARLAAERMSDADLERLERLHQRLEQAYADRDPEAYIQVNHAYHTLVQKAAGNRTLDGILSGLRHKAFLHRYRQLYQPDRFQASMEEHRRLLEAFQQRDPEAAERLMRGHLINQCEALVHLYESSAGAPAEGD